MNKEYININGNAIIIDEKGYARQVEYYDDLEEVLIQENIIEESKQKMNKIEKELANNKHKKFFPSYLIIGFLATACTPLCVKAFGDSSLLMNSINTIFGEMSMSSFITLVAGTLSIPISTVLTAIDYHLYKNNKANDENKKIELVFLKKTINNCNSKIAELKMTKTKSQSNTKPYKKEITIPKDLDKMMEDYLNTINSTDEATKIYTKKQNI